MSGSLYVAVVVVVGSCLRRRLLLYSLTHSLTHHLRYRQTQTATYYPPPPPNTTYHIPIRTLAGITGRKRLQKGATTEVGQKGQNWMDHERQNLAVYEYLCRIGEAKQ